MATLMVTHEVTDLPAWRTALDAGADARTRHGATSFRVLVDGSSVVGLIDFPDDESAAAFLADPDVRRPIPGAPAAPQVRLLHDVDPAP